MFDRAWPVVQVCCIMRKLYSKVPEQLFIHMKGAPYEETSLSICEAVC